MHSWPAETYADEHDPSTRGHRSTDRAHRAGSSCGHCDRGEAADRLMVGLVLGGRSHWSDQRRARCIRRLEGGRQLVCRCAGSGRVLDVRLGDVRRVASGFLDRISTAEPLGDRADSRHLDALLPAAGLADVDLSDGPDADLPLAGGSDRPAGSRRDLQPDERDGTWSLRRSIP
jgi:hypothetical protein